MNLSFLLRIIFFTVLLFTFPIFSDDWSDLDEGEKKEVYGSEKSKKYKMSNIFGEVESWDKHYAVRIIYLYDYTDYPKYNSTQFIPFYYRLNSKIDNREKLRFINYTTEIQKSKVDKSILPLFYWGHNNDLKLNYQLFLPVYYNSSTNNSNLTENKFIFIPIPFYYSFEDKNKKNSTSEKHYSILHGRVLQKKKNSNDTLESSFWFPGFPLMRYTKGQDFYYHYIIPFYGYSRTENLQREETTFLFSLFPFYYSASSYPIDGNNKHSELTHWTLFYYRSLEEDKGGFREYTHKTVWGFPVLPVLYYSSFRQGEGYYKRILTFFHWEKDEKEELNSLSFLPFFFYKKNDYFRIPILFINKDLSSPSASYGKTFVPLLLYYNRWDLSSQTTVLGPWIYTENKLKNESFKTLFPIYWKSESEKKDITLIFPIYANYNDKENDYHFNPIWFSRANLGTLNPSLSLGKKEGIWYLDTDFTFFYYLASLSFRQTIEKPKFLRDVLNRNKSYEELEKENKEEKVRIKKESKDSSDPKITKRKTITREDSLSFSGYSLLFGLLSYEAADSKRHFRLLPLSWFSWDKESDDKVYVAPLFLWYQSDLLEYLVLFPFYGKQKDESSEKKAFLLNVYISEFYKDKNWVEKSILWPLANQYTSEDKSGHRILPFYIHKNSKFGESSITNNYTLASYYESRTSKDSEQTTLFIWPTLFYYKSYSYKENPEKPYSKSRFWFTPFFFRSKDNDSSHTNIFWILDFSFYQKKLERGILFPFYYFADGNFGIFPISLNKTGSYFWTFTFFNYYRSTEDGFYYNFLFLLESEKSKRNFETNLLFYSIQYKKSETEFSLNGLWGYGWNFNKSNDTWTDLNIFSYLGGGYRFIGDESIYNISLFYYRATNGSDYQNWLLGNYTRKSKSGFRNNFLYLIDYENFSSDGSYTWDILFTGIRYHNLKNENYFQGAYGYLWNFRKENEIWRDASFLWLGYSNKNSETIYNFLPIFRSYDLNEEHSRIYGPMLLYTSEETGKNFHLGLLGLGYWYNKDERNKEEDTYILLGSLYREYTQKERGFRARGSLWGWLWDYQKEEETSFEKFSILKLFSYTKEADGTKKILGISF